MADIKINLLPWREELREARKQEFLKVLISLVLLAAAIIFGGDRFYNARIDTQQARNAFIDKEIKVLEDRIDEIKLLQQKRNELLARMKVIQELQAIAQSLSVCLMNWRDASRTASISPACSPKASRSP